MEAFIWRLAGEHFNFYFYHPAEPASPTLTTTTIHSRPRSVSPYKSNTNAEPELCLSICMAAEYI
jgi:hypothetical protein